MSRIAAAAAGAAIAVTMAGAGEPIVRLADVAAASGVRFRLEHHPTPGKRLIETMPGGLAAFDYNNDGRLDLYFPNGARDPSRREKDEADWNRLYRNDGGMKFSDVTGDARVAGEGYAMGAAAADYDNDGNVDLFVAGVARNILYHNTGRGAFDDVTVRAGIASRSWSVAAGWLDFDGDGWLDLFVVNYVKWAPGADRFCGDQARDIRVYCHPRHYDGTSNVLYRNRGDGSFEDVSEKSGVAKHVGKGMSLGIADYDGDGRPDVFVTNDTVPNFLFHNLGNGTFEETGLLTAAALPVHGRPVSSMGVEFRDYDNDGRPDLHVTALAGETFPLFHNDGSGQFSDRTVPSGMGPATLRRSGWGNALVDLDNDGWKDIFTANAHVNDRIDVFEANQYKEPNALFLNARNGTFHDVSADLDGDFKVPRAHRGAVAADLNNDGLPDIVTTSLGDRIEIWENRSATGNRWLDLALTGGPSNRDAIGAEIRIGRQMQTVTTAAGYASSVRAPVHFGLGSQETVERVEILWPSGAKQVVEKVRTNQTLKVSEPR